LQLKFAIAAVSWPCWAALSLLKAVSLVGIGKVSLASGLETRVAAGVVGAADGVAEARGAVVAGVVGLAGLAELLAGAAIGVAGAA
jgi:hypothetical protein